MLLFVIQQVLLSFILIFTVHYIYEFFKDNLTQPKVKDLVNKPKHKYREIYDSIIANNSEEKEESKEIMKAELQDYLKELSSKKLNPNKSQKISFSSQNKDNSNLQPIGMSFEGGSEFFNNNYQSL